MYAAETTQETCALQEIDRANKHLLNTINFTHLAKDGLNFILWKKNVNRAMKALLGIKDFWDSPQPIMTYVDKERNKLAVSIISNTIHKDLKDVTDSADTAHEAMEAIQRHFRQGGCTNQFSLFTRFINLRLDINETEMLTHMTIIDLILPELESTGFTWTGDSTRGLLYQLHMPANMTKDINKEPNGKFDYREPNFKLIDIKSAIQIHLAREQTATETISINSLSTPMDKLSINPISLRQTPQQQNYTQYQSMTPSKPPTVSPYPFSPKNKQIETDEELKGIWRHGPDRMTETNDQRQLSLDKPIQIPNTAISKVRQNIRQCFYCGEFVHSYKGGDCCRFQNRED